MNIGVIKISKEVKSKYNGIIDSIDFEVLNDEIIRELLRKEVIYLQQKNKPAYEEDELFFDNFWMGRVIRYNFDVYFVKEEVAVEIYEVLKKVLENREYYLNDYIVSLELKLNRYLLKEDKIFFLKEEYENIYSEYEDGLADDECFDNDEVYFGLCNERPNSEGWKRYTVQKILCNQFLLRHHLVNGEYDYYERDFLIKCFKEEGVFDIISYWEEWFFISEVQCFCVGKINDIEKVGKDNKKFRPNSSRFTPLEQIIYIEKLRVERNPFKSKSKEEKINCLNKITAGINYDEETQLETLENIVDMDQVTYDVLNENASEYARLLFVISKSSMTNLRKAIGDYNLSPILQENVKTMEQVKRNEKYNKAQKKIKDAEKKINSLI
ncbi:hypothetical protein KFZ70_04245 [Tamlana fucoidanivorans]|uniref:Uncharacterized protein n=1 Tax=Allotamlana fucoidanivorans TaxID=2583814 RepID=A0A5C4SD85_9FLAO|nr:hypothetical protein [Tamlana fucoidanivorans]TNJ41346.1 hypothetical protein FGF67_16060 [Tamlana fucoidanivorans]